MRNTIDLNQKNMNGGDHLGKITGHRYQKNIKIGADWIHLAKHRVQLCGSVTMVMKFEAP
jgi:hypothetical protein